MASHWQANVLIVEQGVIILLLVVVALLAGLRTSYWASAGELLRKRVNQTDERIKVLEVRQAADDQAVSHTARFTSDDEEIAS